MDLCRLGVKQIDIVDLDVVDEHNLNRQILYQSKHVHHSKVESALEQISFHNVRKPDPTIIHHHHFDVLKEWQRTMTLIKDCDIIFNTIDWGDYFDYVICLVALKYSKPLILGGTEPFYGHTVSYFLQGTRTNVDVTFNDAHDLSTEKLEEIRKIIHNDESKWDEVIDLTFLPKDVHPVLGGSTVYSAGTCSHLMVAAMTNYLFHLQNPEHPNPPKQVIFNLFTFESDRWF
jgi:molybdopterin/thiamine biosynthesis adenylyltransferase